MDLTRPTAPAPYDMLPPTQGFDVSSESFTDGQPMGEARAGSGGNSSPQLSWSGAPEGTRSFAVSCFDPDAPTPAGFWHWTVLGIPADVTSLPEDAGAEGGAGLPSGAFMTACDTGAKAFAGAAPPPGDGPHRYVFAVHALDTDAAGLGIDDSVTPTVASFTYLFRTIGRATITGTHEAKG